MSRFEKIEKSLDLENLAKHNRNFDRADADLRSLQQQATAEQQARIAADNAHALGTTAHPAENITYSGPVSGAINVKQAIDNQNQRINSIVGQTGSSNTEIVDARAGTDGVAHPVLKARLDRMEKRQLDDRDLTVILQRGPNVINTSQASGATVQVKGRTLVNYVPNGSFESSSGWITAGSGTTELSTIQKVSGLSSLKVVATGNQNPCRYADIASPLDSTKNYVLICKVFIESSSSGNPRVSISDYGSAAGKYNTAVNVNLRGAWQTSYVKIPSGHGIIGGGFRIYAGLSAGGVDTTAYIDDVRLFEVSTADFTAIGTTIIGEAVDAYLPYVDGVKHLQGASVRKTGKNLLPGMIDLLNSNAVINGEYDLSATTPAAFTIIAEARIPIVAGQSYTISVDRIGGRVAGYWYSADGSHMGNSWPWANATSYTAPNGAATLRIVFDNNSAAGTFNFKNWMLVLGGIDKLPASFEPRVDQYAHCPVTLASSVDRNIADSYDSATGQVFRRWKTGLKLDGALAWSFVDSYTGFKRVVISNYRATVGAVASTPDNTFASKYDSTIMSISIAATDRANQIGFQLVSPHLVMSVASSDSGWTDVLNPNNNAIKALTNGWRANGNNGTVYNSWVSILTGAAPPTNTEAYVAANKAPGWDAWATLDYVIATPVIEQLSGDLGGISLDAEGNTVELLEGVVVREKVTPFLTSGEYYVNGSTSSKPKYRVNRIIAVDGGTVGKWSIMRWTTLNGVLGWEYAKIPANAYDGSDVYITYEVLDRYLYSSNAIDATLTYQSTLGGAVAQATQDIASLKQHDGVQDWILAQYAARLLALEEA